MGIMTGYKIIDFCAQKSIEIVQWYSQCKEAGHKAWHCTCNVSMHLLHFCYNLTTSTRYTHA